MKRILQFAIASSQGGYTQYVTNIWRLIDKNKIHFDFVTFSKHIDFAEEFIRNGCKVYQMSVYPEEDMELFISEFRNILENGYDVIEIHTSFWKNTIVEQLAKERGIKSIVHAHSTGISRVKDTENEEELLERHLEIKSKLNQNVADYYFACSKDAAKWLYGDFIPEQKIRIINNTIDTKRFCFQPILREQIRRQLELTDKFVIGHVGRLEQVKNQQFIIKILVSVQKLLKNTVLLLVGDGTLKESLKLLAHNLGVGDSVIFTGRKKDTELYYHAMDVFLLPSIIEGFPIVLLEAQCNGLKCICSKAVTQDVYLTNDITGIELEDCERWVEEIYKAHNLKREDQSRLILAQGFDSNKQISEIEKIYEGIV